MIQRPVRGEVLIDVPLKGSLLSFHRQMQRVFGGYLAQGEIATFGAERAVSWQLDEYVAVDPFDPEVEVVRDELLVYADIADRTSRELGSLLGSRAGDEQPMRVSADLAQRMGGTAEQDSVLFGAAEIGPFREALLRTAAGVRRAILRGDFVQKNGDIKLFGWVFLPPTWEVELGVARGSLQLELLEDEVQTDRVIQRLRWLSEGGVSNVQLARIDGGPEAAVDDTFVDIKSDESTGIWRFPGGMLGGGSEYIARGLSAGIPVRSDSVRIPEIPSLDPHPDPIPTVEEIKEVPFGGVGVAQEERPRRSLRSWRSWRWLWWLLLVLCLILLCFLLWLLFPSSRTRSEWQEPLVTEHLPQSPLVIPAVPSYQPGLLESSRSAEEIPSHSTRLARPEETPRVWKDEKVWIIETEHDEGSRYFVRDGSVFVIEPEETIPQYIGPAPPSDSTQVSSPVEEPGNSQPGIDSTSPAHPLKVIREIPEVDWSDSGLGNSDEILDPTSPASSKTVVPTSVETESPESPPSQSPAPAPTAPGDPPGSKPQSDKPEVQDESINALKTALGQAGAAERREDWDAAERYWKKAIKIDPYNEDAIAGLKRIKDGNLGTTGDQSDRMEIDR